VDAGVCRPCRKQAGLVAGPGNKSALCLSVAGVTGHQLWFHFGRLAHADNVPERALPAAEPSPRLVRLRFRWVQLLLCDVPRDLSRVSAQLAPVDAGLAERLRAEAARLAGLRGWSPRTLSLAQRGLRILMAVHGPGEPVKASTVRQLSARNMPFPHIIDVLAAASVLEDDRPDSLAVWLDGQLAGLPAQIRAELDAWLTLLRHGGPRRRPRSRRTIVRDIHSIRTFLIGAGGRYSTLRQVTRDDITTWLAARPGRSRPQDASTLRSLFGAMKAERLIFANPTRGVRVGRRNPSVPAPLPSHLLTAVAAAAKDNPALRVAVALAGVHALLPGQIRHLRLDQADLPGRRLDPEGLDRPLDGFTASAISGYLAFRNQRWPVSAGHPQDRAHWPAGQRVLDDHAIPRPARYRRTAPRRPHRRGSPGRPGRSAAPSRRLRLRPPHRAALRRCSARLSRAAYCPPLSGELHFQVWKIRYTNRAVRSLPTRS
jgi:hypothetical protein